MTINKKAIFQDVSYFWRKRYFLATFTVLTTSIGLAYALLTDRVYEARALMTPKDIAHSLVGESILSHMGGSMGNPFANTALLTRAETVLKSRNQIRALITTHNLLPEIFPERWDAQARQWKKDAEVPTISEGIDAFRKRVKIRSDLYSTTIQIRIEALDPVRARDLVNEYLEVFNQRVREGMFQVAQDNRRFLEQQLLETTDPILRNRIQNAIVAHIQNSMMMNASAFEMLDSPEIPRFGIRPKRKLIVAGSMVGGLVFGLMMLFAWRRVPPEFRTFLGSRLLR